ncbi:MAG: ATP-binding protein [Eubacterium sp.]|nr:ATP-binding protein [Eubacterium sp.]
MAKTFNVAAVCMPQKHYMVGLAKRLEEMKGYVDDGKYFMVNRARQYGKTTLLLALEQYLQEDYDVVFVDFQTFGNDEFASEHVFALSFAETFVQLLEETDFVPGLNFQEVAGRIRQFSDTGYTGYRLKRLFSDLSSICACSDKPIVLIIDEVDSASDNQVFLDFLAQIRAYYIKRVKRPFFQSVILSGVYDVKNLKQKLRPDEEKKYNSPWNIAADFDMELSFSKDEIAGMLLEYEADYHTGMDLYGMAGRIFAYTAGYPFLVSRLCKLMDEQVSRKEGFLSRQAAWTERGFQEAVRMILAERNTLFDSLAGKLEGSPQLNAMLYSLLFTGKSIAFHPDEPVLNLAAMLGFIREEKGVAVLANRIFEMRLYNLYLSSAQMQALDIYRISLEDKNQFLTGGHLNMRLILEKFAVHFNDLYGDRDLSFVEEEGRKYFLLYLRPIINGTGNYYIESRTRGLRRTDVVVDYRGEQYVIEMKIWHGNEYHQRGEKQLIGYLEDYHIQKGYMVSFNFNKKKRIGVQEIRIGDKILIEAVI